MATTDQEFEGLELSTVRADIAAAAILAGDEGAAIEVINRQHARSPLTPAEVYLFPAEVSNQNLDSWFTRMAESSLRNYEVDAKAGVPLMNSHRTGGWFGPPAELPLGSSYGARLTDDMRLVVDHYMLRGWHVNDVHTDELIRGIEAGVIRSMSIGFSRGWLRCSVCGGDMLRDRECKHLPGMKADDGETVFAWVEDARLAEDSMVWKGATPDAGVLRKARSAFEQGWATRGDLLNLEEAWHIRLLPERVFWIKERYDDPDEAAAGAGTHEEPARQSEEASNVELEQVRAAFAEVVDLAEATDIDDALARVRDAVWDVATQLADAHVALDAKGAELAALAAERAALEERIGGLVERAALGDQYRADLVDEAVRERVRVQGTDFNAELYRASLEAGSLDYVRAELDAWKRQAQRMFVPGRQVKPDEAAAKASAKPAAPAKPADDLAFKV